MIWGGVPMAKKWFTILTMLPDALNFMDYLKVFIKYLIFCLIKISEKLNFCFYFPSCFYNLWNAKWHAFSPNGNVSILLDVIFDRTKLVLLTNWFWLCNFALWQFCREYNFCSDASCCFNSGVQLNLAKGPNSFRDKGENGQDGNAWPKSSD
jgi:hypothetical protein